MRAWNNNTFGQFQTRKGAIYECFFSSVEPQKFEPIVDANEYKSGSPSITELRAFCVPNLAASLISTYLLLTFPLPLLLRAIISSSIVGRKHFDTDYSVYRVFVLFCCCCFVGV